MGRSWHETLAPDDRATLAAALSATAHDRIQRRATGLRKDGTSFAIDLTIVPVVGPGSESRAPRARAPSLPRSRGHYVYVRDLTERRHMEDQLIFAGRMAAVGTLAAGVAHEINNPLAYIVANIDFTRRQLAALPGKLALQSSLEPDDRPEPGRGDRGARRSARGRRPRAQHRARPQGLRARQRRGARPGRRAPRARFVDQHRLERDPPPRAPGEGLRRRPAHRRQRVAPRAGVPEPAPERRAGDPRRRGRAKRDPREHRPPTRRARDHRGARHRRRHRARDRRRASSSRSSPPSPTASAPGSASRSAAGSSPISAARSPSRAGSATAARSA